MVFCELTENEFKTFTDKHETKNFFQSIPMYERFKINNYECYLVGVKNEQGVVLAASIIFVAGSFLGKKSFDAPKGFILDYSNLELINFFTKETISFVKSKGGYKLSIDPYIDSVSRDADGNIIPNAIDNRYIKDYLVKIGYKYLGEAAQVKWVYSLDIASKTKEELMADFRPSTRNYINRTINKYKLIIRKLTYEELDQFKKITSETSERRSFYDSPLKYYQDMYKCFKDEVVFIICELNCSDYIHSLEIENDELQKKHDELSDSNSNKSKKETMLKDIDNNKDKITKTKNLMTEKGNIIPLSGAMFMLYGDEIVYLFSGSYAEYMSFYGQYRIQWEMIKYAAENNFKKYNFYGIKDFQDKNGKDYGIYDFKKGFGGYVEELLGAFEIGFGARYKLHSLLKKLKK